MFYYINDKYNLTLSFCVIRQYILWNYVVIVASIIIITRVIMQR